MSKSLTLYLKVTPSLFPIQLFCPTLTGIGQSTPLLGSLLKGLSQRSLSAYSVSFKNHCSTSFWMTSVPHLQHFPASTFSFAKTVWQLGHQFASALPL